QRHVERAALRLGERGAGAGDDDGLSHGVPFPGGDGCPIFRRFVVARKSPLRRGCRPAFGWRRSPGPPPPARPPNSAPAFRRSVLSDGQDAMPRPRTTSASTRVHGPWQITATGSCSLTNALTNATADGFMRSVAVLRARGVEADVAPLLDVGNSARRRARAPGQERAREMP